MEQGVTFDDYNNCKEMFYPLKGKVQQNKISLTSPQNKAKTWAKINKIIQFGLKL